MAVQGTVAPPPSGGQGSAHFSDLIKWRLWSILEETAALGPNAPIIYNEGSVILVTLNQWRDFCLRKQKD